MELSPRSFRKALGKFATGVAVVTTWDRAGNPYGVTVNSFTSVSLEPLLVLLCLHRQLSGLELFLSSRHFAVNVLKQQQAKLAEHFAARGSDRSVGVDGSGATGIPIVKGSLATLECRLRDTYPGGDHLILLGQVEAVQIDNDENQFPLLFFSGAYRRLV